jgi:hypothetical protein
MELAFEAKMIACLGLVCDNLALDLPRAVPDTSVLSYGSALRVIAASRSNQAKGILQKRPENGIGADLCLKG